MPDTTAAKINVKDPIGGRFWNSSTLSLTKEQVGKNYAIKVYFDLEMIDDNDFVTIDFNNDNENYTTANDFNCSVELNVFESVAYNIVGCPNQLVISKNHGLALANFSSLWVSALRWKRGGTATLAQVEIYGLTKFEYYIAEWEKGIQKLKTEVPKVPFGALVNMKFGSVNGRRILMQGITTDYDFIYPASMTEFTPALDSRFDRYTYTSSNWDPTDATGFKSD